MSIAILLPERMRIAALLLRANALGKSRDTAAPEDAAAPETRLPYFA
jgi:hypothetical protein